MTRLTSFLVPQILLPLFFSAVISGADHYSRADFPPDFVFGSGIAAPQYEGAALEDGRTLSIWDTFSNSGQSEGATKDVTCDGYHKYKGDVNLMGETGLDALRLSISWSRLIPNGRGPINEKGLRYYNNLINELISNGIQPHITLQHLDLPQALQDEYGGWISREIVKDFVEYADACFKEFGDRVLHWTTLNEVKIAAIGGYDEGNSPPGRFSTRSTCAEEDSAVEPYKAGHYMLLSHSAAAKLYREKYKDYKISNMVFRCVSPQLREKVEAQELDVRYIPTEDQLADIFTKPLSPSRFKLLCSLLPLMQPTGVIN